MADEPADPIDVLEDAVFAAVRKTRQTLHVHSERIFLVGCGEGAAVAYRLGLTYPERFAGVVAINGWIPGHFRPLGRLKACRDLGRCWSSTANGMPGPVSRRPGAMSPSSARAG